jgi:pilus assembly protein CpaB
MPRGRLLIIVAFIIILGGIVIAVLLQPPPSDGGGGVATSAVVPDDDDEDLPTPTPIQFVEIVIAVQQMPRGFRILPSAVELRRWPAESAPFNAIFSLEDVIGKIARTDIFIEQPILTNMIVQDLSELANVGSDLAAVLPSGRVAISIPIDRLTSVAYGIQPGDRVDVIMSMMFVDVDEVFQSLNPNCYTLIVFTEGGIEFTDSICGRPDIVGLGFNTLAIINASEAQRPRLVTQRTVQNAGVMYLGNFPPDGRFLGIPATPTPVPEEEQIDETGAEETRREGTPVPTADLRPDIITLSVSAQDAVILTWAVEARLPITFALRSASDASEIPTDPVNLDYLISEFDIRVPTARTYAIEPAIRRIRQLFAGSEISLGSNQPAATPAGQ